MDKYDSGSYVAEANREIDEIIGKLAYLKENIWSCWEGPAATKYAQVLGEGINLTRLKELLKNLENEVALAKIQQSVEQGSIIPILSDLGE